MSTNSRQSGILIRDDRRTEQEVPAWLLKFARRVLALNDGRYVIVLSKHKHHTDWTVQRLGKIEE